MYEEKDLIAVARRENNTKRGYLLVNPLQGKHFPVSPTQSLALFKQLSLCLPLEFAQKKTLFIGFAETATAIGMAVALEKGGYYMQTTRELDETVEFFDFSESHSHATEQKLSKTHLDQILPEIEEIIFVEDEVTTGNTIEQIIKILRDSYTKTPNISVLSILNGMNPTQMANYQAMNVALFYLRKTDHSNYGEIAAKFPDDGQYHQEIPTKNAKNLKIKTYHCPLPYLNTRRLCHSADYEKHCEALFQWTLEEKIPRKPSILLLGTEEFMFAPLYLGKKWEEKGHEVRCHATTRSPIMVSHAPHYPLQERYALPSLYDPQRNTFIYQLSDKNRKDQVVIFTDSPLKNSHLPLCQWLNYVGYEDISLIRYSPQNQGGNP